MKHQGKIALVTGASRGIGRSIALQLAKEGAEVILNYRRSKTECEEVLNEIAELGGSGIAIRADVGNEDKTDAMFEVIQVRVWQARYINCECIFWYSR